MKKIFKLFLCSLLVITTFFSLKSVEDNTKDTINASSMYTKITDDNGNVVKYRGSDEAVLRLTEYDYPNQELRACWVSNFVGSLPAYSSEEKWKTDYAAVLDKMESYGLNCIIFHIRTHNNAMYKSELNPIARWFLGVDFEEFDPLEWAIEETHRRGIEFHAWLNPYRINDSFCGESYPEGNPANDASNLLTYNGSTILNPGLQSNRDFIVDTCMEVVENYDVDAIHFDDYFYISGVETSKSGDWKRQQVDLFIEDLANHLDAYNEANNKAVQLGISPSGIYQNGGYETTPTYDSNGNLTAPLYSNTSGFAHYGNYLYSDTLKWINEEWIDYIMPQTYWSLEQSAAQFGSLSRWWSWAVAKKDVNLYLGMGIYMPVDGNTNWQKNKYEIRDQILNGSMYKEVGGFSLYSYNYISNSDVYIKTGMDILKNDYWSAKIPCDIKKSDADRFETLDPLNLKLVGTVLSWSKQDTIRGHIVYRVPNNKVLDTTDLSQIYYYGNDTEINVKDTTNYVYYVSTVNLANEISTPYNTQNLKASSDYVIEEINKLPSVITLEDEGAVLRVKEIYEALPQTEKTKVTNYQKLVDALELVEIKKTAANEVKNFVDKSKYSLNYQAKIDTLINETITNINNDATKQAVDSTLSTFKNTISTYPIAKVELKDAINNAITEVNNYYNTIDLSYYEEYLHASLENLLVSAKEEISEALSEEIISQAVTQFKTDINAIPNVKDEFDQAINSINNSLNNKIQSLIKTNEWLKDYEARLVVYKMELINELKTQNKIDISKFPSKYSSNLGSQLENYIYVIKAEIEDQQALDTAKDDAIKVINTYENSLDGHLVVKEKYINKINKAKTIEDVNNLLTEFKKEYDSVEEKKASCNLFGVNLISILSAVSLLYVIIRKKH